jgi:hypothetical protein
MNDKRLEARKHLEEGITFLRLVDESLEKLCECVDSDASDFTDEDKDFFTNMSSDIAIMKEGLELELYGVYTGQRINPESSVEQYHAMLKWWSEEDE